MSPWKILAMVAASRLSFLTPDTLNDTVIGAVTVGMYKNVPPLTLARSAEG